MQSVPLSSPDITDLERDAVLRVLSGTQLSLGPLLPAFETAIAEAVGSRQAIAVNSGTSGLHLCVKAAGIRPGDEVITPSFSFIASANCICYEGGIPKFVDIDATTYNLMPELVRQAVSSRTAAILPVHAFGRPCDMAAILAIARESGLPVIEDSCEALGAKIGGRGAGTVGTTGVFAFYPNKQITTGEGGVIVTDDEAIAEKCRSWRNQGRSPSAEWLQHDTIGYNYRLSDVNCALGIAQVQRLDEILAKRRAVAYAYTELLGGVEEVVTPAPDAPDSQTSWFVYVVRVADTLKRGDRDRVMRILQEHGVACSRYFAPIHLQKPYREMFGYAPGDFPVTEFVADRTIALPFHNRLTRDEIAYVCSTLIAAVRSTRSVFAMQVLDADPGVRSEV